MGPSFAFAQAAASPGGKEGPVTIRAEQITGRPDREVHLERKVEIIRGPTTVTADTATYDIVEDQVEASGDVRMCRAGNRYSGTLLRLKMDTGQGFVLNPSYHLGKNNAQGDAERIDFQARDRATVTDGSYSTCEGPDPDSYLKSDTLDLDSGRDIGVAHKAIVYFKDVPILPVPLMSFPLSGARKSGFLPPTFGTTSKGGFELAVPYYLNIAPNRDLTLYPKIYGRRGFQLGADARYLGATYSGETRFEEMFRDRVTGTDRYAISSTHAQTLPGGWTYAWNLNAASDDNYPNDFANTITTASQRLLLRDIETTYYGSFWSATARVSNYQVLQDPAAPITRPYDRLPQIVLHAGRYDVHGFDWAVDSDLSRFWHPDLVRGDRLVVNPQISYPILAPGYFVTPKLSLNAAQYQLNNQAPGMPDSLSRVLPTFSLDSGLIFERNATFFGRAMTQTLEPRLFYVYTPYRDQSDIPVFDSGVATLSFAQLFSENQFVGSDRISDANQLTAAVVSRYLEADGGERMRFTLGQRFYFSPQRVTLPGFVPDESRSDLLLGASGRISAELNVDANMQYSQSSHQVNRAAYGTSWQPSPKHVLNLQYLRDVPTNLEQVDVSGEWPLAQRWYGVGRVNYSLLDRKIAENLFGLEYKADCWVFRLVAQRVPTAASTASTSIFFQLELNGLTRLGSNPLDALRNSIPGYQLINQPNTL